MPRSRHNTADGSQNYLEHCMFLFIIVNSADPDEKTHSVGFYLALHCVS